MGVGSWWTGGKKLRQNHCRLPQLQVLSASLWPNYGQIYLPFASGCINNMQAIEKANSTIIFFARKKVTVIVNKIKNVFIIAFLNATLI